MRFFISLFTALALTWQAPTQAVIQAPAQGLTSAAPGGLDPSSLPARSINFPGTTSVLIPHSATTNFSTKASIFAAVKTTDTSANLGIFTKSDYGANRRCLALETWGSGISPRGLGVVSSNGTTVKSIYGEDAINNGSWHVAGFTYNANTLWNYWDSIREDGQTTLTANTVNTLNQDATTPWRIGALTSNGSQSLNFIGKIFCPISYGTDLTQAQVDEYFNMVAQGLCTPASLSFTPAAMYRFTAADSTGLVYDSSGNNNNGTYNGALTDYSTDVPSGLTKPAYALRNTDQDAARYTTVAHSASTNFSTAMTAMIWVKNATTGEQIMFGKADFGSGKRSWFLENSFRGGNTVELFLSSNGANNQKDYQSSIDLGTTNWYSVAFTYTPSATKLYINGIEDTAVTKHTDTALASLYQDAATVTLIGTGRSSGVIGTPFKGDLDRPMLWSRDLTAAEVLSVHNATLAKTDFSASITGSVLNLALNKGAGLTSFTDLSGSGNHGTPTGYLVTDWVTGIY